MITDQQARHITGNPDGCDILDLAELINYVNVAPYRAARRLWGVAPGFRPVITVGILRDYCRLSIQGREARLRGNIADAFSCEYTCDAIYNSLPKEVRW